MRGSFIFGLLIFFVQLNAQLDLRWDTIVEGNEEDLFSDVSHTADGGCLLIGSSSSTDGVFIGNHGGRDGYIAKYDIDGNLLWDYVFGGSKTDNINDIVVASDGGFIVTGSTNSSDGDLEGLSTASNLKELLVKFTDGGQIEWLNKYSTGDIKSAKTDSQGNIYTITPSGSFGIGSIRLSKYDADGNRLWNNTIDGSPIAQRIDMTVDDNGNVYQLTEHISTTGGNDFRVTKFDASGSELWNNTYGGVGSDGGFLIEIRNERLLVAGSTISMEGDIVAENGGTDGFIAIIDFDGSFISSKSIGGGQYDFINDMKVIGDKIFISGQSNSTDNGFMVPNPGSIDVFIAEIDLEGDVVWIEYSGGTEYDISSRMDIVNDTMLVLGYYSTSQDGNLEGADEDPSIYLAYYDYQDIVSTKNLIEVDVVIYPNPASEKIIISTEDYQNFGIKIYSLDGALQMNIDRLESNEIDISNLPSGLLNVSLHKNGKIINTKSIYKK